MSVAAIGTNHRSLPGMTTAVHSRSGTGDGRHGVVFVNGEDDTDGDLPIVGDTARLKGARASVERDVAPHSGGEIERQTITVDLAHVTP